MQSCVLKIAAGLKHCAKKCQISYKLPATCFRAVSIQIKFSNWFGLGFTTNCLLGILIKDTQLKNILSTYKKKLLSIQFGIILSFKTLCF